MSRIYVYSTLANDQEYSTPDGKTVIIAGKANVANKHLLTPRGVVTPVTEEQLAGIRQDRVFAAHLASEFLAISVSKKDADEVARDLNGGDASQQNTPESMAAKAAADKPGAKKAAPVKAKTE